MDINQDKPGIMRIHYANLLVGGINPAKNLTGTSPAIMKPMHIQQHQTYAVDTNRTNSTSESDYYRWSNHMARDLVLWDHT
eukprot:1019807-Ditylum_brightwellii.AAC.2